MAAIATVGRIHGVKEEIVVEWTIPQFSTLSPKVDDRYHSPVFFFCDNCWYLRMNINGESERQSEGNMGLYLMRDNSCSSCTITYTFSFKNVRGEEVMKVGETTYKFDTVNGYGWNKYHSTADLMGRKSELFPNDVLTVCCSLKSNNKQSFHKALRTQTLLGVSRSMRKILDDEQQTDVVLKVEDKSIQAHKVILQARSEVFQKMLSHDMFENRTGEIKIDDIEGDVFQEVLAYMYSGLAKVTPENVSQLYIAADRYDLKELKMLCSIFMEENMSDDLFCDAFVVAEKYNEKELMQVLKEYLLKHPDRIIKTEKWQKLAAENPVLSLQILTMFVMINADKNDSK